MGINNSFALPLHCKAMAFIKGYFIAKASTDTLKDEMTEAKRIELISKKKKKT
jgi:hypothetical protein